MIIKYKILSVDEAEQSFVVRFYTDTITEAMLASQVDNEGNILRCRTDTNITFPSAVSRPRGAAFDDFVMRYAPATWFALKADVANPAVDTTMTDLAPLVGVERSREVDIIEGRAILKPVV